MTKDLVSGQQAGWSRRSVLGGAAAAALGATVLGMPYVARAQTSRVRMSLDFRIYGGNSPFFYGAEKGIFKDLGIDIQLDGAAGSGEAVRRVAGGTHDFGFADASTLVEFSARNPEVSPKFTMCIFDRFPAVVLSLKRKPVKTLQEMVGLKIGTGTSDAGSRILPALLSLNKIDPKTINFVTVDVKLRDTMLLKGEVDAVIAFDYTAIFNLVEGGVKLEDITLIYFADNGFNFPGNAILAPRKTIEQDPDLVRRMTLAVTRSWVGANKDRAGCIAAVTKRESLLNPAVERQRLDWVLDKNVMTENVRKNGLGAVTDARLESGIALLKDGFSLPQAPTVPSVYDPRFLPDLAERRMT